MAHEGKQKDDLDGIDFQPILVDDHPPAEDDERFRMATNKQAVAWLRATEGRAMKLGVFLEGLSCANLDHKTLMLVYEYLRAVPPSQDADLLQDMYDTTPLFQGVYRPPKPGKLAHDPANFANF